MTDHGRQLKAQTLPEGRRSLQEDIVALDSSEDDLPLKRTVKTLNQSVLYVSSYTQGRTAG